MRNWIDRIQAFASKTEDAIDFIKKGKNVLALRDQAMILWDLDESVTFVLAGKAEAYIEAIDKSKPEIICMNKAKLQLVTKGASAPEIYINDYAEIKVKALGGSSPSIRANDYTRVIILARENSKAVYQGAGFAIPVIVVQDQAKPRFANWPEKWEACISDIYIDQKIVCFEKEHEAAMAAKSFYSEWVVHNNRYIATMRIPGTVPKICSNVVHFRWKEGVVHLELPGEGNARPWYTILAGGLRNLTEFERDVCTRHYLDDA